MKNIDSRTHVRGESIFVDDIPQLDGTLHAAVFDSPIAHGKIKTLDVSAAKAVEGVVGIFTAKDIVGNNQIGSIIPDEELFAEDEVHFIGMPIALVVAETEDIARAARSKIKIDIEELTPIVSPREAKEKELFICPPRTFSIGDTDSQWDECDHVFEGQASIDGQEHIYLETQGCYIYPMENGHLKVHSGTQAPLYVQRGISKVLGMPLHMIEVDVIRLGGAFGGKEDQGTPWAAMAALAVYHLKRPVKLILHRLDDIRMTGKRHPYEFDYKIGLTKDLKIKAYQVTGYQNGGASADVSPAVMERTLFHGGGSYYLPNASITVYSCRTNLPPNTAFRGFGAPQGMYAMECAIYRAAEELKVEASQIQKANLLNEGDSFPYGQEAIRCNAATSWNQAEEQYNFKKMRQEVEQFNAKNKREKKGLATFPLCFGISFTKTSLNQGRSLVHVYTDGSVSVTTGVIEMGQAVNTKIVQVASKILGIPTEKIRVNSTNTTRIANASPTAASSGADLNGGATKIACTKIIHRLIEVAAKELGCSEDQISVRDGMVYQGEQQTQVSWEELVFTAHEARVALSEHGHYATPTLSFDKEREKGHPFAYHVYGTAVAVVKLDCIRGVYQIEQMKIVHDFGESMNLDVDKGQVEGAVAQGIGLMTIEELLIGPQGKYIYDSMASYKVPDIYSVAQEVQVEEAKSQPDPLAIMGSKAVGEPPLMYGMAVYFAIHNAMRAFNPDFDIRLAAPMTHQRTLMALYEKFKAK